MCGGSRQRPAAGADWVLENECHAASSLSWSRSRAQEPQTLLLQVRWRWHPVTPARQFQIGACRYTSFNAVVLRSGRCSCNESGFMRGGRPRDKRANGIIPGAERARVVEGETGWPEVTGRQSLCR